ncbi:MAG: hypothetical protein ABSD98_10345 [Candidatus Korobacteraceae bacterium]
MQFVTPLVVAIVGYFITRQLKAQEDRSAIARDRDREERERQYAEQRENKKDELERRHTPHIELQVQAQFFGQRNGQFLATISVLAENLGQVLHKFSKITLRIRGIKDEPFEYWKGREPHVLFPHKILNTNLVQSGWDFIFIEPGVAQRITQTTLIPTEYTYISVYVEFEYKKYWPHTAEAVFAVPKAD